MTTWDNKDRPAFPQPIAQYSDGNLYTVGDHSYGNEAGFTKFEEISLRIYAAAIGGIFANADIKRVKDSDLAEECCNSAEALLKEWEKGK